MSRAAVSRMARCFAVVSSARLTGWRGHRDYHSDPEGGSERAYRLVGSSLDPRPSSPSEFSRIHAGLGATRFPVPSMARSPARLLVVLAASASACAWLQMAEGGFQKPTVAYKSASLSDVTLSGATLNLVLTVDNPNPVELALADVDYRLAIDGHQVATGRPPEGLQIPAKGPGDVTLPASFKFADLGQAAATVLAKGSAGYKAEGTVGVKTPGGVVHVPLSHEGTFTLPEMPGIALGTPKVTAVALDHASVELPVTLTGKGSLPVPLQALQAAVTIGGAHVGEV